MVIILSEVALADLEYWDQLGKKSIQTKISSLMASVLETPFSGKGKPEPLKHSLSGKWSRRINREHRMVYSVYDDKIEVHSLRGHYKL